MGTDHQEGRRLRRLSKVTAPRPGSRPGFFFFALTARWYTTRDNLPSDEEDLDSGKMIRSTKDFWAGLIYLFFGASAIWIARDYAMGTGNRMGPAYFPSLLGGIL